MIAPLRNFVAALGQAVAGLALDLAFAIPSHWGDKPKPKPQRPANVYSLRPGAPRRTRKSCSRCGGRP